MKKSTHSKIKNTAILFELLTRQVAADTIKGVEKSPALTLIKEFFKSSSILAKELMLYQTLLNEKYTANNKAEYLINTVLKLRNKINNQKLHEQKYALISEIKKHYDLQDFFKTNLNNYRLYASIYRLFEGVSVAKVADVVKSRFTILEHITKKSENKSDELVESAIEDYLKQDKEIKILAYKLMIDKFNDKYAGLSTKQKNILREYINNISNTVGLKNFIINEGALIREHIKKMLPKISDQVIKIKLSEVCNLTDRFNKIRSVKEEHVLSLLLYYELLKELKNVKA